jgi:hypothetical protein
VAGKTGSALTGVCAFANTHKARCPSRTGAEMTSICALSAMVSPPIGISAVAMPRPIIASAGQPRAPRSSSVSRRQFSRPRPLVARPISAGSSTLRFVKGDWLAGGTLEILNPRKIVVSAPRCSGLNDAYRRAVCAATALPHRHIDMQAAAQAAQKLRVGFNLDHACASRRGCRSSVWSRRVCAGHTRHTVHRRHERARSGRCRP